jgi:hypothetical protein
MIVSTAVKAHRLGLADGGENGEWYGIICSSLVERERVPITILLRDEKAMALVASIRGS